MRHHIVRWCNWTIQLRINKILVNDQHILNNFFKKNYSIENITGK